MKFNIFSWNNYKQTERGKSAIMDFELNSTEPMEIAVTFKYNERMRMFYDNKNNIDFISLVLDDYWNAISECPTPNNLEEAKQIYITLIENGICLDNTILVDGKDYKFCLHINPWISWILYQHSFDYFFPNLIPFQAYTLYKIADAFDIELPSVPKKSDYKARCMYYWELCEIFHKFRTENNLSPAEFCAFLYDYAPNFLYEEKRIIPEPSQAWFIGGKIEPWEIFNETFWQCNQETRRGDILVHYETSPISAITCIWQASTDGLIDPFFHYYGCAYMTNKTDVPHITIQELKNDIYFSTHPLVKKNFQGVNGWAMTGEDYINLLRMFEKKGFNSNILPKPYASQIKHRNDIHIEHDVETLLLEPLLNEMGLTNYKRQVSIRAGRGHRIFADYALHYNEKNGNKSAKVLIEAKYHIRNPQEAEEAFSQARSYAKLLDSSVIILCDKDCLLVYDKKHDFDRQRYIKFYWDDMKNPNKFLQLKKILQ